MATEKFDNMVQTFGSDAISAIATSGSEMQVWIACVSRLTVQPTYCTYLMCAGVMCITVYYRTCVPSVYLFVHINAAIM